MKHLKIGTRMALAFAALLLMMAIVTLIAMSHIGDLSARIEFITNIGDARIAALNSVESAIQQRAIAARNLALLDGLVAQATDVALVKRSQANIDRGMQALQSLLSNVETASEQDRAMLAQLQVLESRYLPVATKVVALATSARRDDAVKAITGECMPLLIQVIRHVQTFQAALKAETDEAGAVAAAASRQARLTLLGLGAAAFALGSLIAWLLGRSITRPLTIAVAVAQRVAAGDLSSTIATGAGDETGQLMNALKHMNDSLVQVVGEVRGGTRTIATTSSEINAGNLDLSSRTEQQASSIEQTAASMEELNATVKRNADSALSANLLASDASKAAVKGGVVVAQVVQRMGHISASATRIVDIISVIDSIAFQTNILALNAAVEAARAGEQGRGFAVVATEVRNLAQRSAGAAKEIKNLIQDAVENVDAGARLVDDAGVTMNEIVERVRSVSTVIAEISAASGEQSIGIEQINQAVMQMDQVTQQNAALVEQAAAAAATLQDEAVRLDRVVGFFNLAEQTAPPPSRAAVPAPHRRSHTLQLATAPV